MMSPVCTENLSPTIVVMKSAKDGGRTNDTGALYQPRDWSILVQRAMRSDAVVVMGVRFQNPTQMRLAQDIDVVQTLTPDLIRSAVRQYHSDRARLAQ